MDLIVVLWKVSASMDLIIVLWKVSDPMDLIVVSWKIFLVSTKSYGISYRLNHVMCLFGAGFGEPMLSLLGSVLAAMDKSDFGSVTKV